MQLLDLPAEILALMPQFIRNIEDFTNAASSCRTLRNVFNDVKPEIILRLADSSAPTFFAPHPQFLIMATASQISQWAIGNKDRTRELEEACMMGIDGLHSLCLRVAGLTMADIRRLHLARFDIINPLANKIDQMAGVQWGMTPYENRDSSRFWYGGVSEATEIDVHPERAAFQIIIYWELFGSTLRAFLQPELNLPRFGPRTRIEFIKFCVPTWFMMPHYFGMDSSPTGPYLPQEDNHLLLGDQFALQHILSCSRWKRLWEQPLYEAGAAFDVPWRQELWWNMIQSYGLESMALIKDVKVTSRVDPKFAPDSQSRTQTVLTEEWRQRLSKIREQISRLESDQQPEVIRTGVGTGYPFTLTTAPNPVEEIAACSQEMRPGY